MRMCSGGEQIQPSCRSLSLLSVALFMCGKAEYLNDTTSRFDTILLCSKAIPNKTTGKRRCESVRSGKGLGREENDSK